MPGEETNEGGATPQRVTVSLETLRTEIRLANAELELRLKDSLASKDQVERVAADVHRLEARVDSAEKWITQREPLASKFDREHDQLVSDVEMLKTEKAEDKAVKDFKRWIIGGGALTAFFMAIQIAIALYVASHGGGAPPG